MTAPGSPSAFDETAHRFFLFAVVLTTAAKLALAAWFPLTGDEAYFVQWGRQFAGSYYDHGPVTGWVIGLMLQLSDAPFVIRLPAVFSALLVALVIRRLLQPMGIAVADYGAGLFLWSPVALLSVLMTTDIPLLVLSSLSVAAAARAQQTDRPLDYVAAGAFLGLAFLSKYFAVLLGVAYAVWWLGFRPRRWAGLGWLLLGVAPFLAQHLYWNYHHAWVNVVFNLFTRQERDTSTWYQPFVFALMVAYLVAPAWLLVRQRAGVRSRLFAASTWRDPGRLSLGLAAAVFVVPHAILLLVSFTHPIGLHWLLSFVPFAFVIIAAVAPPDSLRRLRRPAVIFGASHLVLIVAVLLAPVEWARGSRSYRSIVMGLHPDEMVAALRPYLDDYYPASTSYSKAALLDFYLDRRVPVLGTGSFHGRQDDLRTDWRTFAGRDLLVLTGRDHQLAECQRWFEASEILEVHLRGATLKAVLGRGFNYERYREEVLQRVADTFYVMPPWLERFSSGCFFRGRYDLPARSD